MYDHVQDARAREMLMRSLGAGGPTGTVGSFNAASIDVTQIEQALKNGVNVERKTLDMVSNSKRRRACIAYMEKHCSYRHSDFL